MIFYFKLLETFVLRVIFNKGEYNFNSKNFSPLKLVVVGFMFMCTCGFFFLGYKTNKAYAAIEQSCPGVIDKIHTEKKTKKEENKK